MVDKGDVRFAQGLRRDKPSHEVAEVVVGAVGLSGGMESLQTKVGAKSEEHQEQPLSDLFNPENSALSGSVEMSR